MANNDLTRPHVFQQGTSSRTLLVLHGTGGDEHNLLGLAKAIDPNASILSPRGMYLENGMNRFFERYPDGTFNEASINQAVDELAEFLTLAIKKYSLDPKQILAIGFSNGANTAAALLVKNPVILSGAALFGSTKPYRDISPVNLSGKNIWLANGDQDHYSPLALSEKWVEELKGLGAAVTWLRHPGGHQISAEHVNMISKAVSAL
jgi:phospholipase/carboxylesterase